jgi:2-dehydropantoate 2-reductase
MEPSALQPRPSWLQALISDTSPPPRLYRWTISNLSPSREMESSLSKQSKWSDESRRIHIFGVGNIGRLLATSLANLPDKPPVTLVVRRRSLLEHWQAQPGVEITRSGIRTIDQNFEVEIWSEEPPERGPVQEVAEGNWISNLIICVKAPDALRQTDRLRRYLGPESTVVFAHNGMSKLWPPNGKLYSDLRYGKDGHPSWLVCVVTHGVTSAGPFSSIHASPADAALGTILSNASAPLAAQYLENQLKDAPHLKTRLVSRLELWILQAEKLVVNSIINPLTAILRCQNGALFAEPDGDCMKLIDILLEEASQVFQGLLRQPSTQGILNDALATRDSRGPPADWSLIQERFSMPRLREMIHRVGAKVKDNYSSMVSLTGLCVCSRYVFFSSKSQSHSVSYWG